MLVLCVEIIAHFSSVQYSVACQHLGDGDTGVGEPSGCRQTEVWQFINNYKLVTLIVIAIADSKIGSVD